MCDCPFDFKGTAWTSLIEAQSGEKRKNEIREERREEDKERRKSEEGENLVKIQKMLTPFTTK